jgi:hypothetical protein
MTINIIQHVGYVHLTVEHFSLCQRMTLMTKIDCSTLHKAEGVFFLKTVKNPKIQISLATKGCRSVYALWRNKHW